MALYGVLRSNQEEMSDGGRRGGKKESALRGGRMKNLATIKSHNLESYSTIKFKYLIFT
jgi:hypothetical protein